MRRLTTEQLPSVEWWTLLRTQAVRRFALTILDGTPCHPLDAAIAGLLEALAPHAFADDARDRFHRRELMEAAAETGRNPEDLIWEQQVRAQREVADDDHVWAVVLALLEEDQHPPGIQRSGTRQSGRRRRSRPPAGTAAIMRLFIREPWRRWYAA